MYILVHADIDLFFSFAPRITVTMTKSTRTFLELKVGRTHTVDVLLHVRRTDVTWFHSSVDHRKELLKLLSQQIVPKEFEQEIDCYHELRNRLHRPPPTKIGEKNQKGKGGKAGRNRKVTQPEPKPKRDVCHVFGDNLRVTYRVEELNANESATLIFPPKKTESSKDASYFRQLPKLSKRIILWCYPINKNNPTEPAPEGGGFPRPEMMPITSLFRPPHPDGVS
jgi:hypothetical protein